MQVTKFQDAGERRKEMQELNIIFIELEASNREGI
jgi:hypothetical protein